MGTRSELNSLHYHLAVERGAKQSLENKYEKLEAANNKMLEFESNFSDNIKAMETCKENYNEGSFIWDGEHFSRIDSAISCAQAHYDIVFNLKFELHEMLVNTGNAIDRKRIRIEELEADIRNFKLDEEDEA